MSEQTEKATPRRKQKAREEGQFVRSRELTSALVMVSGAVLLGVFSAAFVSGWRGILYSSLSAAQSGDLSLAGSDRLLLVMRSQVLTAMLPVYLLMAAIFCVALLSGMMQSGGIVFNKKALELKFARLSPVSQMKQIFSMTGVSRTAKSLVPTILLVYLAARQLESHFLMVPLLSLTRVPEMFRVAHVMLLQAGGVMLVWSAIDYMVEWRSFERRLRMSKQEIRQEMKDSEGSPMVRRRIRSLQRQMRRKRLQADMARACVVVTNPTHYAVALEFSFETMQAPKVLAKGMNLLAERIKEEARWAGVPVVPNPPLARSLYKSVEEGQSVPVELYTVVAEILAYLYREELERRARAQNAARAQHASTAAPMASAGPEPRTQQEER
jgi:flagellar biosynthetic protein FlhB